MSLSKTLVALSGEYLVAAHLCMQGIVASLTLKTYPSAKVLELFSESIKKQTP